MNQKNIQIEGKLYEVITMQQLTANPSVYNPEFTAVLMENENATWWDGSGFYTLPPHVLPFRQISELSSQKPGIYGYNFGTLPCPFMRTVPPVEYVGGVLRIIQEYDVSNILDATNVQSMQELIDLDSKYKEIEYDIISAGTNDTHLKIRPGDTPEMAAFKQAVNAKGIDIDKYKARIGSTFNNDKRLIQKSSITFPKMRGLLNALDLSATLIIDNADPNVPNPIPGPIKVNITEGDFASISFEETASDDEIEDPEEDMCDDC